MKKGDRQMIFDKYGGKCAYCGCELSAKWHADHCSPVHRLKKRIGGNYINPDTGLEPSVEDIQNRNYERVPSKIVAAGFHKPENDCIENMMPSCPSCNLYKHSADLETFRFHLTNTIKGLNNNSVQYKFAKRYGLIEEINKPVVFYFETLPPPLQGDNQ